MAEAKISFGTAGWRGIISNDFTFDNVKIVSQAIADYINEKKGNKEPEAVIGYDPRFLGEDFSAAVAEVLAANGIKVHYSEKDVPTPAISYYIIKNRLSGGINITASHNPPQYSGIKFSPEWGGPALPETTSKIEENCKAIQSEKDRINTIDFSEARDKGDIKVVDLSECYIERIKDIIDTELIKSKISVVYDAMHSSGREYMPRILSGAKLKVINSNRDVLFGGHRPEPSVEYLDELKNIVVNEGFDIGIATDGDADRFGIIDTDGTFITPNQLMGLVLYYLHKKGYKGVAVRSVMTSSFMDAVAHSLGVEVIETPVGFKYIGDILTKQDMIVGGEESAGLTIGGHLPEKDGILACLLAAEMRAGEGKPLVEILNMLQEKVGRFITARKNYKVSEEAMKELRSKMESELPEDFGSFKVKEVNRIDGYKFLFDKENAWLGMRFSGTEPVVRIYVESSARENVEELLNSAEKLFNLV
ncbi:phosphoglucomutase/phosphomannomutase family protein [Elusimicrobiota bacterium]